MRSKRDKISKLVVKPFHGLAVNSVIVGMYIFSFIEMIGFYSFANEGVRAIGAVSSGSQLEAIMYLFASFLILIGGVKVLGIRSFWLVPPWLSALIFLSWISLFWSSVPLSAFPRIVQTTLVTVAVFVALATLSPRKIILILTVVFSVVITLDLLSVIFVDAAIHQGNIGNEVLTGKWRGLHLHKNQAGLVAAMAFMFFVTRLFNKFRFYYVIMASASFVFLLGTGAKFSLFLAIFVPLVWRGYLYLLKYFGRGFILYLLFFGVFLFPVVTMFFASPLIEIFEDPRAFTGRTELWNVLILYTKDYLLGGSGFGSFWRIGAASPIINLTSGWGAATGQAHNGYLDMLIMLGIPGLLLSVLAFVVAPIVRICKERNPNNTTFSVGFVFVIFGIFQNLLDSTFLIGNIAGYFFLLLGIGLLRVQSDKISRNS